MIYTEELIVTDLSLKGNGISEACAIRKVLEVYTKSGTLLAFHDPLGNFSVEDMIEFGKHCQKRSDQLPEILVRDFNKS